MRKSSLTPRGLFDISVLLFFTLHFHMYTYFIFILKLTLQWLKSLPIHRITCFSIIYYWNSKCDVIFIYLFFTFILILYLYPKSACTRGGSRLICYDKYNKDLGNEEVLSNCILMLIMYVNSRIICWVHILCSLANLNVLNLRSTFRISIKSFLAGIF